jgi:hypothetical protein
MRGRGGKAVNGPLEVHFAKLEIFDRITSRRPLGSTTRPTRAADRDGTAARVELDHAPGRLSFDRRPVVAQRTLHTDPRRRAERIVRGSCSQYTNGSTPCGAVTEGLRPAALAGLTVGSKP